MKLCQYNVHCALNHKITNANDLLWLIHNSCDKLHVRHSTLLHSITYIIHTDTIHKQWMQCTCCSLHK